MLCENGAPTISTESCAQLVCHIVRIKLFRAIAHLQVRIRNLDIGAKRRPSSSTANGTMADTDICRCGLKRKSNLIAETVSREHPEFTPPVIYLQDGRITPRLHDIL
jgi:hypothetical protein